MVEASIIFEVFFLAALAIAVGEVAATCSGEMTLHKAWATVAIWVMLASIFACGIYLYVGHRQAAEFTAAYIIEYCLSVDNLFVFVLLFQCFSTSSKTQPKILYFGIIGAAIMRGLLLFGGTATLHHFSWVNYLLGALMLYTAVKITSDTDEKIGVNWAVKLASKFGLSYFALVLIAVETTDLVFAMDSVPAILSISQNPFILITSNIFALMGLRSLYFILALLIKKFHYLQLALSFILGFIGVKMMLHGTAYEAGIITTLSMVILTMATAVVATIYRAKRATHEKA